MAHQRSGRNLHPADVRARIWKAGGTFKRIAELYDLHRSTVSAACVRPQPSGNRAIAAYLGCSTHDLWPEWFDPDGHRRTSRTSEATKTRTLVQRQKERAA